MKEKEKEKKKTFPFPKKKWENSVEKIKIKNLRYPCYFVFKSEPQNGRVISR